MQRAKGQTSQGKHGIPGDATLVSHVQESVCFVDYQEPDGGKAEIGGAVQVVNEAAWCAHQDVDAPTKTSLLCFLLLSTNEVSRHHPHT